jgi:hypothetical protein
MRPRRLTSALVLALTTALVAVLPAASSEAVTRVEAAPAAAATRGDAFAPLAGFVPDTSDAKLRVNPSRYTAYSADLAVLRSTLGAATATRPTTVTVPAPDGTDVDFSVVEDSVMEPALQARHPEIRTYAGTALDTSGRSIRLDVTPLGFHASVRSTTGARSWFVDPAYDRRGTTAHLSYYRAAVPRSPEGLVEKDLADTVKEAAAGSGDQRLGAAGAAVVRKTYRLAFVTDPTYAAYFGSANVFAAKTTLINRVDQVYNDDMAIKFVLIDDTDTKLNLDTNAKAILPNGPCGASACYSSDTFYADGTADDVPDGCDGSLLTRNEFVLGQLVGADSFDIGHIGLGVNGGGIAGLGVVGGDSKADGCTGLPFPEGDFYAVDYVAHEMGHQMGGDHTFNGNQVNCSATNRALTPYTTQVEPGSGSSVMAYAGICGNDNLQPHSDPYFSHISIEQITDVVADDSTTSNEVQTISLSGFDTDGDTVTLTYPSATPVTITRGALTYNALAVAQKIFQLTGCRVTVGGYDGTFGLNDNGIEVTFNLGGLLPGDDDCRATDVDRIGVGTGTGGVSGFVGVQTNGGETTNEGVSSAPANANPTVTAPADKSIPIQTPFSLTGSGTDPDAGQNLVYLWEQTDPGGLQGVNLVDNAKTEGPLFRMFGTYADVSTAESLQSPSPDLNLADGSPTRSFPDLAQVVGGITNAETGECPAAPAAPPGGASNVPIPTIECYAEFLPTADYANNVLTAGAMHFRLSARDQFPTGGGYAFDDVTLTLSASAGPFLVTSRGTAGSPVDAGTTENVVWDVAGTNSATYATNVKLTLSIDGGETFPYVLAASTANDGTEQVTWPNVTTTKARVKVEAVGNYFYDVNNADFTINGPVTVTTPGNPSVQYSDPIAATTVFNASSPNEDGDQLTAVVTGLPGVTATRTTASADGVRPGTASFTLTGPVTSGPGTYPMTLTVSQPDGDSAVSAFSTTVTKEDATATYTGDTAVVGTTPTVPVTLTATIGDAADGSAGDIADASVTFVNRVGGATLCTAPVTGGPATGTAQCTANLARSGQSTSYTVGTIVGGRYVRDAAADDATVTITTTPPANPTPDTTIQNGPSALSFVTTRKVTFVSKSSLSGSTFVCKLDNTAIPCAASTRVKLKEGTHVFSVAARSSGGVLDPTPATRVFASPFNDGKLSRDTTSWKRVKDKAGYRGAYTVTSKKGQKLSLRASGVTRIALVAYTGPGAGRVAILCGKKRLAVLDLSSSRLRKRVLIPVAFSGKRSGKFSIVTLDNREVRIDGLGLLTS